MIPISLDFLIVFLVDIERKDIRRSYIMDPPLSNSSHFLLQTNWHDFGLEADITNVSKQVSDHFDSSKIWSEMTISKYLVWSRYSVLQKTHFDQQQQLGSRFLRNI